MDLRKATRKATIQVEATTDNKKQLSYAGRRGRHCTVFGRWHGVTVEALLQDLVLRAMGYLTKLDVDDKQNKGVI